MRQTVYRYDRPKTRRFDLFMLAFCLFFGLSSLADFNSELSDFGRFSWFDIAFVVLFAALAMLFLAKMAGLGFLGWGWSQIQLSLDEEGLTYAQGGLIRIRRFPWVELSAVQYVGPAFLRKPSIVLHRDATGLKDRPARDPIGSGPIARLPDIFDAPVTEIAATMNEYRDRALGIETSSGSQAAQADRTQP